jgi:Chaperone of endosialidase
MKNLIRPTKLPTLFVAIFLVLTCFALSPLARAVCHEGCDIVNINTFLGDNAFVNNTTGRENTAIGAIALSNNTTGFGNTANGFEALYSNTTGSGNTAIGWNALDFNNGSGNTATGFQSLEFNSSGNDNTAMGDSAMFLNFAGNENTAIGFSALYNNFGADDNTAIGASALYKNENGNNNTAVGMNALYLAKGDNNIALGVSAGYNLQRGSNNIYIGNAGNRPDNNDIRIGTVDTHKHTFIAGISGSIIAGGVGVIIDADGHLGTIVSSARFKQDVKPMDKASEAILALKPVTFRYKKELDANGIPQFGLMAEQVEKVDPDLVAKDNRGKPYTVRYEAVNAMLLNEFIKEHMAFVEEQHKVQELEANAVRQQKQIEQLSAGLQKVSARLELNKSAPQTVLNDQ